MKKTFLLLLISLLVLSCKTPPIETEQKGGFKLELLFEQDSCKMYRFKDGGTYIYWSDCTGNVSWNVTHRTGKTSNTEYKQVITSKN